MILYNNSLMFEYRRMHTLLNIIISLYFVLTTSTQAPSSGCDLITSEGKCFSFFTHSGINWTDARVCCQTWGGDLASIDSASEDSALKSIKNATTNTGCFIGLNDMTTEGVYVWSDGSNSTYRNWNPFEPNDLHGDEECSETDWIPPPHNWNDIFCYKSRSCYYCSSKNVSLFGKMIGNSDTYEELSNDTVLYEDTTLYCITENKNIPHVNWSYVDLDGSRSVLSSTTDPTTGVSVMTVNTDKPGYYSCQVTRNNGVSRVYGVTVKDLSLLADNRELAFIPNLISRKITVGGGDIKAECTDPYQRGLEISWNNITVLPEIHHINLTGNKLSIQNNGLPAGVYVFECLGRKMLGRKSLELTITFLTTKSSLVTINEIVKKENATLEEIRQGIEIVLTYTKSKDYNADTNSTNTFETLVNASLMLTEKLETFSTEVSNDTINNVVDVTSNLLKSPHINNQKNSMELEFSTVKLVSVIELVGAVSMSGLNANTTERVFTSDRVNLISQIIPNKYETNETLALLKLDNPGISERVSIPGTVVGDLSSDGEFRYSIALISVSNTSNSDTNFSLGSSLLSLTVSAEKRRNNLTSPILLTFHTPNVNNHKAKCVFLNEENSMFDSTGLNLNSSEGEMTVCESTHLTSFGVLIRIKDQKVYPQDLERLALSIISYVLLSCSLIALILSILIPIVIGKEFFKVEMNRIYFNYALALAFAITVFIFGTELPRSNTIACTVFVGLMHYFWLAVFSWGLCISIEIVYLLWITSLNRKALFWFLLPFGWGLPIPIVVTTVVVSHFHHKTYIHQSSEYCFLSNSNGVIWSFIGPILVMLSLNMIGLIIALVKIIRVSKSTGKSVATSTLAIVKQSLINSSILFPVLGAPWIVLPFSLVASSLIPTTVFEWLFIILNTPSGVIFFILFTLRNETVRQKLFRKKYPSSSNPNSTPIKSSVSRCDTFRINRQLSSTSTPSDLNDKTIASFDFTPLTEMPTPGKSTDMVSKPINGYVMPDVENLKSIPEDKQAIQDDFDKSSD